jgi:3D (Asp-Asp-Asp) domain-containing protein
MTLLVFFLGGASGADLGRREEPVNPRVEIGVKYRPLLISSDRVQETDCRKRDFYLAPWVLTFEAEVSAYSSEEGQTDADPWIAANNRRVFDGGIATNVLPCGAQLVIPDLFGDKVFTVNDRMNSRFHPLHQEMRQDWKLHLDVWMPEVRQAWNLGRRANIKVFIIGYPGT